MTHSPNLRTKHLAVPVLICNIRPPFAALEYGLLVGRIAALIETIACVSVAH
jgi:hypothetical protein